MSSHIEQTIAELQKQLQKQEDEVIKTKDMINRLCDFANKPRMYQESELKQSTAQAGPTIQSDQFYGQPLASSVKKILQMRKTANMGPATVREIYDALKEGGYNFDTKNDANAMRGLRVSLSKNTALFHKLPNNRIGLVEWYPKIKRRTRRAAAADEVNEAEEEDLDTADEGEEPEDEDDNEEEAT